MLQVSLSQLRAHPRRFLAITVAVLLAVAFLSATLIVNASTKASLKASVGESYATAALVVSPASTDGLSPQLAPSLAAAPQLADVYASRVLYPQARLGDATLGASLRTAAPASLEPQALLSGTRPGTASEVTVDDTTAARQGLAVGDAVTFTLPTRDTDGGAGAATPSGPATLTATISGITAASNDPRQASFAQFVGTEPAVTALDPTASAQLITATLVPGATVADVQAQLTAQVTAQGGILRTADEQTTAAVSSLTDDQDVLTVVLLAFAAVALLVAGLVVANTFSVLVAQRTRELALLRCVGADRRQIRHSVMVEALLVGLLASLLGVGVAVGAMAALLAAVRTNPDFSFATLAIPVAAPVAGILVGTLLTVLAALLPARAATAVAPLAALRPAEEASLHTSGGRGRLISGVVLLLLGGTALVVGATTAHLGWALPGGAASFVGFLLASGLFVPRLVALAGRAAAPAGVPGKMAAANAVRNPRRTTATASALLIGVTLVTMMMTGAATTRTALEGSLSDSYPVDLVASSYPGQSLDGQPVISAAELTAARALPGVAQAIALPLVGTVQADGVVQPVFGLSDADAAALLSNPSNRPTGDAIVVPVGVQDTSGPLTGAGAGAGASVPFTLATNDDMPFLASLDRYPALPVTDPRLAEHPALVWIATTPGIDEAALSSVRTGVASTLHLEEFEVSGAVLEKAMYTQVINTLLLVVTGLLAVAVVIALIGVANTLSLSVLERTRENSLLRALGLTRGQLRGMLALEAVLIAGVAAVLGSVLGSLYGWAGAQASLGTFATISPVFPWWQLAAVVVVAALAGLLASVLPARRAARLSPVAGLATD